MNWSAKIYVAETKWKIILTFLEQLNLKASTNWMISNGRRSSWQWIQEQQKR